MIERERGESELKLPLINKPKIELPNADEFIVEGAPSQKSKGKSFFDLLNDEAENHTFLPDDILKLAETPDRMKRSRTNLMKSLKLEAMDKDRINKTPPPLDSKDNEDLEEFKFAIRRQSAPILENTIEVTSPEPDDKTQLIPSISSSNNQSEPTRSVFDSRDGKLLSPKETPFFEAMKHSMDRFKEFMKDYYDRNMLNSLVNRTGTGSYQRVLPLLRGVLKMKGSYIVQGYKKRYLVLKDKKLYIYKDENMDTLIGCLDFDLYSAKIDYCSIDMTRFRITPIGANKTFTFQANSSEIAKQWLTSIQEHIEGSECQKGYCKLNLVIQKNFWKQEIISEKDFVLRADTGDILLFKSKTFAAKLQRSLTRCEFDHVALLLRYSNGEIVLLEATGKEGVGLCRWKTFRKNNWQKLYHKLVFRKLQFDRNPESIGQVEKFVKSVVGKKYKVILSKLFKKKSNMDEELNENRTFFCSELIAACYKKLGLLPPDISSASYWPSSFAPNKKLQFLDDAKFTGDYLLDFGI
jgi:hypothetical protein